jgi:hypothetical protein
VIATFVAPAEGVAFVQVDSLVVVAPIASQVHTPVVPVTVVATSWVSEPVANVARKLVITDRVSFGARRGRGSGEGGKGHRCRRI